MCLKYPRTHRWPAGPCFLSFVVHIDHGMVQLLIGSLPIHCYQVFNDLQKYNMSRETFFNGDALLQACCADDEKQRKMVEDA